MSEAVTQVHQTARHVIVGGGPGGYVAAIRLAQLNEPVTLVERYAVGGVCLHWGCIPSKALIYAGGLYHTLKNAHTLGIHADNLRIDWAQTLTWKDGIIRQLTQGIQQLLKAGKVTLIQGHARFESPTRLQVRDANGQVTHTLDAENILLATGSVSTPLPGLLPDGQNVLDIKDMLALTDIPTRLLIIGGGVIGLEMASVFAQLGTQITVIEKAPVLLPGWDADAVAVLRKRLEAHGVALHTASQIDWWEQHAGGLLVRIKTPESPQNVMVDRILSAAGRRPNTAELGLENIGLTVDHQGFIPVNPQCQTALSHIYAIGDVSGAPMLAHKASRQGLVAASVMAGQPDAYDVLAMPSVLFSDPEIAMVGLTLEAAEAQGLQCTVGKFPFAASGRALASLEPADGFVKVIAEFGTDRLLGVHIAGPHAADLIAEATLAIELGATAEDLALTVHAHPTYPESLMEAAEAVHGQAIHLFTPKRRK
jgi:dihydrolipoamide dehydrogenase